jgi:eukaryotic-like serine/threonine-protein kinase
MTDRRTVSKLGTYKVGELLGSGGMASVYKGYDTVNKRDVAIKVLSINEQTADFVKRFKREVKVVKSLRHPNIVEFYDFGEEDDTIYMVQELLPGPTLADRIRKLGKRRIPDADIPAIVTQLADALDFAHNKGIIHRDVKPSNAIYNVERQMVLTDFGIARTSADALRTATGPGIVMGTPGYIAPEQAISSATITPACDIYALGVLLFEMLTAQLPFEADTPMGVVLKHLYDEPPKPRSLRPELPKALDDILLRAMHKEPDKRFATATELSQALQEAWPVGKPADKANADSAAKTTAATAAKKSAEKGPEKDAAAAKPRAGGSTAKAKAKSENGTSGSRAKASPAKKKTAGDGAKSRSTGGSSSAAKATSRATTGRKEQAGAEGAAQQTDRHIRLRVGLLTACLVGLLLLGGLTDLDTIARGWGVLARSVMGIVGY